jgi:hypothetical protein
MKRTAAEAALTNKEILISAKISLLPLNFYLHPRCQIAALTTTVTRVFIHGNGSLSLFEILLL